MARKALIIKSERDSKYKVRNYNRCKLCGRTHGYFRKFGVCRICLRKLALEGKIPGMKKGSW